LINLLQHLGIVPAAVVGHSSGEIAAAYAAGAIGMKEALLISHYRGAATSISTHPGAMGAVGLGRQDAERLLIGDAVIACENSRSSVTISGNVNDVEASLRNISQLRPGVLARTLKVDKAYHSSKFLQDFETRCRGGIDI
jgi:acyl transferase domain-containing protein